MFNISNNLLISQYNFRDTLFTQRYIYPNYEKKII